MTILQKNLVLGTNFAFAIFLYQLNRCETMELIETKHHLIRTFNKKFIKILPIYVRNTNTNFNSTH